MSSSILSYLLLQTVFPSLTSDNSIDVKGPVNFFQIYEKYNPGGNQTFGGKEFTGN